ncbi:MAG TPA: hypothetical protein VN694_12835 [Caulobacteraceae bacterium]|nr:hypothetical protein [Caulobacteraceae bacterium]
MAGIALDTNILVYAEGCAAAGPIDDAVFAAALGLAADHHLQIFDAIILAGAASARCDGLLSEDLHDGFAWRGVAVLNPFRPENAGKLRQWLREPARRGE